MEEMRNGETAALGIFFSRYHRLVFDVAKRILRDRGEAEDILQDVFIEVFKKADLYDPGKGSVKTWLLQYAYHRSFNRRKYLALRSFYNSSPAAALVDLEMADGHKGREGMSIQDWQDLLSKGFKELNSRERQMIELVAFEGLTVREASQRMKETYVNGRNHYYRALKKLRQFFGTAKHSSRQEEKDDVHS
jgi:RNA polymerase sigma-70 factor (ECF subfamily)